MADYSCLMFHNPYNPDGTEDEGLEMMRIALIKMIQRWGMDEASVEEILARETWMEPEEAIRLGFADESVALAVVGMPVICRPESLVSGNDEGRPTGGAGFRQGHSGHC